MCNLLSLGRLYKTKRNNQSKKLDRQQEKATLYHMTDREVSLSYFVLPGKLYLLVGPRPGTRTYSHRQKCWKARLLLLTSFFSLPSFTRLWPNVEEKFNVCTRNCSGIFSKRGNSLFLRIKMDQVKLCTTSQLLLSGIVALAFKIALVPVGCRWMREVRR